MKETCFKKCVSEYGVYVKKNVNEGLIIICLYVVIFLLREAMKGVFLNSRVRLWWNLRRTTYTSWHTSFLLSFTSLIRDYSCTKEGIHLKFWRCFKWNIVKFPLLLLNQRSSCWRMGMRMMLTQLSIEDWLDRYVTCAIRDQISSLVSEL